MLRALVVDDEFPAREELVCVLEECEAIEVVGTCEDGEEALAFLRSQPVDVVFLDIHMPAIDGISIAMQLNRLPDRPRIVFVTGYSEHAIKAFELDAADYLLKPYTLDRVERTVNKLMAFHQQAKRLSLLPPDKEENRQIAKLPVWVNGRMLLVKAEDVLFARADGKRSTLLYTAKGEFQTSMPLRELGAKLGKDHFIRTHKSYLVSMDKIEEIIPWFNNTYMLVLQGCPVRDIPVARHFIPEFNARMRLKEYK